MAARGPRLKLASPNSPFYGATLPKGSGTGPASRTDYVGMLKIFTVSKYLRPLHNQREAETESWLEDAVTRFGSRLVAKIRLADVVDVDALGLQGSEKWHALSAHLDFVAYDGTAPLFAVEYDGPQHQTDSEQRRKDHNKNQICELAGLPLLRVDRDYLARFGRFSLVSWLAEVWFLKREFDRRQSEGEIGADESFHPMSFVEDVETLRPSHYPFAPAHWTLMHDKNVKSYAYGLRIGEGDDGYLHAYTFVDLIDGQALLGQARLRAFRFDAFDPKELVAELSVMDAVSKLTSYKEGKGATDLAIVQGAVLQHKAWPEAYVGGSGSHGEAGPITHAVGSFKGNQ